MALRRSLSIKNLVALRRTHPDDKKVWSDSPWFIESEYKSILRVVSTLANDEENPWRGFYRFNKDEDDDTAEPMATLEGIEEANGCMRIIKGRWEFAVPLSPTSPASMRGTFEMISNEDNTGFSGWWREEGSEASVPWNWQSSGLGKTHESVDSNASIHAADAENGDVDKADAQQGNVEPKAEPRKESSSQIADILESVWMDRYGVLCSWMFFLQTVGQLLSFCAWETAGNTLLNQACNSVYATCYLSFILTYCVVPTRPGLKYTAGIFMYLIGYILFLAIYSDRASQFVHALYILGCLAFLSGSSLLIIACYPPHRNDTVCQRFSPVQLQSSLFWGSVCFFIGSVIFLIDSLGFGSASRNGVFGLAVFAVGRVQFLRGSQTARCSIWLMQRTSQGYP
eukprot:TRINITY_DN7608_c0_g1_i1.p1 TRINITY_DN7608_c0_g1~~TRINITY_DN7608_c0_g1_i1.p1  ORF type:complete len:398 (+),score=49.40 TRINITY_DN7608_c0_g1_i1:39-1232(+)